MKYTLNISFICSFVFSIIHLSLNNKLQIMKYCAQTWLRDPLLGSVLQQVFHYSALTLNVPMLETQSNQLYKQPAKHTPALPLQHQRHFCFKTVFSAIPKYGQKIQNKCKYLYSEWTRKQQERRNATGPLLCPHMEYDCRLHSLHTDNGETRDTWDRAWSPVTAVCCMMYLPNPSQLPRCTLHSQELI